MLLNYNLPPWLSTKKFFVLLALFILRIESITSDNFDVFLEPLVEELLTLSEGVSAYDALKDLEFRRFSLRAMLLWTIYDFPHYGIVGGFSYQEYVACPYCSLELGANLSMELRK